ncbi:MAG TPA: LamG-like jellyroll fold domain-containing protein, partial [Candidatus Baltobacteraceae bacterium]|nr:LamG-like jellyroll fold domain-containing protein [Candidatus Baltobacteraceae bacterium]
MNARLSLVGVLFCLYALAACSHHGSVLPPVMPAQEHRRLQSGAQSDQYSTTILNDGPAAYYRLDDSGTTTAADSSGNNLNGTIGASVTTGAAGLLTSVSDAAMAFPGTQNAASTVNVAANGLLQPASAISLEAWIKFTANPATYAVVVGYGSDSFYAPYDLFFRAGNQLVAQFYLSSGVLEVPGPALKANTVYHIVSTFDGSTG